MYTDQESDVNIWDSIVPLYSSFKYKPIKSKQHFGGTPNNTFNGCKIIVLSSYSPFPLE